MGLYEGYCYQDMGVSELRHGVIVLIEARRAACGSICIVICTLRSVTFLDFLSCYSRL